MRLLIALAIAALPGCAHVCPPAAPRVIDTGCAWAKPMTASSADTPDTKREIIAYELARQKNCPPEAR